ncbi:MAG TPA: type II CAAX endopeptidase family protein [Solirubrobacteraceae bacterium]|nr:type II CAAX endopeptidase family protein [Solirubrobacteraceae bacterium]
MAAVPLGLVLGFLASSVVVGGIAAVGGYDLNHLPPGLNLSADVLFDLGFVAAALYMAKVTGGLRASDFGFRRVRIPPALGVTVLAAVSYYVVTAIYASALHFHGNEKLPRELGVSKNTAALAGAAVFVCLIAPVAEEFFFRGFIFGVLRRWRIVVAGRQLGPWVAAVITGILFGLAHSGSASPRYLVPLGFLGFVLCLVRWRTGSLYPCIALHALNNSLALGVGQLSWNAPEVVALVVGSVVVAVAVTLPLAGPRRTATSAVV